MKDQKSPIFYKRSIFSLFSLLSGLPKNLICSKCLFFIGPMPVNLDRSSLLDIYKKEYLILEKSDGIRYLFFCDLEKFFIIDRKMKTNVIFKEKNQTQKILNFLDGELTFNLFFEKYYYLIYDAGIIKGDWRISSWDLYSRLRAVNVFIFFFNLKISKKKNFIIEKIFFYKYNLKKILDAISINIYTKEHLFLNVGTNHQSHCNKNDGIIFSPLKTNYSFRTTCTTFKWKYEFENTIDLMFNKKFSGELTKNSKNSSFSLVSIQNRNKLFKVYESKKPGLFWKKKVSIHNKLKNIGEFRYIQKKGSWTLRKVRFDKITPNSLKLLINTLKIITECIIKAELLDNIIKFQTRKERGKCCEKY
jgi:mRNA guanylyltransferase